MKDGHCQIPLTHYEHIHKLTDLRHIMHEILSLCCRYFMSFNLLFEKFKENKNTNFKVNKFFLFIKSRNDTVKIQIHKHTSTHMSVFYIVTGEI